MMLGKKTKKTKKAKEPKKQSVVQDKTMSHSVFMNNKMDPNYNSNVPISMLLKQKEDQEDYKKFVNE